MAGRKPRFTAEEIDRAVAWREAGRSCAFIARRLGKSESAVYWNLLREGVDPVAYRDRPLPAVPVEPIVQRRGDHVIRRFTRDEDDQLLALEAEGHSYQEIARRLGRQRNSVYGRALTLTRHQARGTVDADPAVTP
ncbi:hypothetical protein [Oceanibacterium hippocampi]|uniref:Transposase n=1 Tax=Oceanibacterium hippocampi TaxID=745714 RepID=A0A1Y5U4V6_9PROT|nr:hypothetical protein [Oceanibacterium hippocampi]SLN77275.1 Transposase [Oceanibacterium hippocampi]